MTGRSFPVSGLVVSDLDGCLLDADTYAFDAARPALAALAEVGCPLVLCSGKTRAEMEPLARAMGLSAPFIIENGGALLFPPGSFAGPVPGAARLPDGAQVVSLGAPRAALVVALREIAAEAGVRVRGFADLDAAEVAALTGLSESAARRALCRDYDEPFLVEGEDAARRLEHAARRRGLSVTHGGRFHHLLGGSDKGLAVRTLRAVYALAGRDGACVGLGDADTDLPLLRAVDRPIVVPARDGRAAPSLARELPQAESAPAPGPAGWSAALLAVLEGRTLPRVDPAASAALP